MELKLLQKEAPVWIEEEPIVKRQQLNAEVVIPDSREDAKCLVWTRGGVLLKGKEPSSHNCSFTGEVWATVLYLNESGRPETLRIQKEFDLSADLEGTEPEALPQISWQLSALEGRLLNPRKLGINFEILASISSFSRGRALLDSALPDEAPDLVHLRLDSKEALVLRELREKPFSVRDTLTPEQDRIVPRSIAGESVRFMELTAERLGSRCIVKGELELRIWGPDEKDVPVSCSFRLPFSQLAELNEDCGGEILVEAEPSSFYLEWLEGINGERSLDAEIHGVFQLRSYARQVLRFAVDGYSSRMPSVPIRETRTILCSLKRQSLLLGGEETLPVPEDLQTLLAAEPKLGALEWDREQSELPVSLDLLVRRGDGTLDALHRSFRLRGEALPAAAKPGQPEISRFEARIEAGKLFVLSEAKLVWDLDETEQMECLTGLELQTESAWDPYTMPSLSLVPQHGETLWDLAKEFHSSVEAIAACNPEPGGILLIPVE